VVQVQAAAADLQFYTLLYLYIVLPVAVRALGVMLVAL
jgi:hypothetical protein